MRFLASSLVVLFATSCGYSTTFVMRLRDSSSRAKPNNLFGRIMASGPDSAPELELMFGRPGVDAEWSEDATTVTHGEPSRATVFEIIAWLELDGLGSACARIEDVCEPTAGDVVLRQQVKAAPTVVFSLDFK